MAERRLYVFESRRPRSKLRSGNHGRTKAPTTLTAAKTTSRLDACCDQEARERGRRDPYPESMSSRPPDPTRRLSHYELIAPQLWFANDWGYVVMVQQHAQSPTSKESLGAHWLVRPSLCELRESSHVQGREQFHNLEESGPCSDRGTRGTAALRNGRLMKQEAAPHGAQAADRIADAFDIYTTSPAADRPSDVDFVQVARSKIASQSP